MQIACLASPRCEVHSLRVQRGGSRHDSGGHLARFINVRLIGSFVLVGALLASTRPAGAQAPPPASPAPAPSPAKGKPGATTQLNMLYGDDHVFGVVTPAGWTLDSKAGLPSNIRAVLYPKGQKWQTATAAMYVNPLHQRKGEAPLSFDAMIARDTREFIEHWPKGKVTEGRPLPTGGQKTASVRYFTKSGGEAEEAVAYVEEQGLVMLIVLTAHTPRDFRGALPAFEKLVGSYVFMAGNVRTGR